MYELFRTHLTSLLDKFIENLEKHDETHNTKENNGWNTKKDKIPSNYNIQFQYKSGICFFNITLSSRLKHHIETIKQVQEKFLRTLDRVLSVSVDNYIDNTVKINFHDQVLEGSFFIDDMSTDDIMFLCDH